MKLPPLLAELMIWSLGVSVIPRCPMKAFDYF
jgi:hypothetical protein